MTVGNYTLSIHGHLTMCTKIIICDIQVFYLGFFFFFGGGGEAGGKASYISIDLVYY